MPCWPSKPNSLGACLLGVRPGAGEHDMWHRPLTPMGDFCNDSCSWVTHLGVWDLTRFRVHRPYLSCCVSFFMPLIVDFLVGFWSFSLVVVAQIDHCDLGLFWRRVELGVLLLCHLGPAERMQYYSVTDLEQCPLSASMLWHRQNSLPFYGWKYSIECVLHVFFIHLDTDGRLGCFHILAIVSNAANISLRY